MTIIMIDEGISGHFYKKKKMKFTYFNLTIDQLLIRFYLMMLSVIIPVFIGVPILAVLALPIFLSAMMGLQLKAKEANN